MIDMIGKLIREFIGKAIPFAIPAILVYSWLINHPTKGGNSGKEEKTKKDSESKEKTESKKEKERTEDKDGTPTIK